MNNNPIGYNQGMDPNVFGMNVLNNNGTSQGEGNPTLNLLNQSNNQFGGGTGNPTLDLLNQGNGGIAPQNNNQFYNSGNPTLDLLNESQVQPPQDGGFNFVGNPSEVPVEQAPSGGAFSFLSQNEAQIMNQQAPVAPAENSFIPQQPVNQPMNNMMPQGMPSQPMQPQAGTFQPTLEQTQPMNFVQPSQPVVEQPVVPEPAPAANPYGFVPMMNQQAPEQPVQPAMQPQPNPSMGTVDEINFSFIPLREEAPAAVQQPVQMPVSNQPTATQVFGQAQVMQPQASPQNMVQPMMPQGMPGQPMQPQMGAFQPAMQPGVVQQSLDTLFPTGMPDGNGNFPQ